MAGLDLILSKYAPESKSGKTAAVLVEDAAACLDEDKVTDAFTAASEAYEGTSGVDKAKALRVMVKGCILKEDMDAALKIAEQCKAEFPEEVVASLALGEAKLAKGLTEDALSALDEASGKGDKKMQGAVNLAIAKAYIAKEVGKEALDAAETAQSLFAEASDKKGQGQAYQAMANAYLIMEDYDSGLKTAKATLAIFKELGLKTPQAYMLLKMGQIYLAKDQFHPGLRSAVKARDIFRESDNVTAEAKALVTIVQAYCCKEEMNLALREAQNGLRKYSKLENDRATISAYEALVHAHTGMDDVDKAMEAAEEAGILYKKLEDKKQDTHRLLYMASSSMEVDLDGALEKAQEALANVQPMGDKFEEAKVHLMLSRIYNASKDEIAAKEQVIESQQLFQALGCKKGEAKALLQLARINMSSEKTDEALGNLIDAQKIAEELGLKTLLADAKILEAEVVMVNADEAALESAASATHFAKENGMKKREGDALLMSTKIYLNRSEFMQASEYAKEAESAFKDVKHISGQIQSLQFSSQASFSMVNELLDPYKSEEEIPKKEDDKAFHREWKSFYFKAYNACKSAVTLAHKTKIKHVLAGALQRLGLLQISGGRAVEAILSCNIAKDLYEECAREEGKAQVLITRAQAWHTMNDDRKAVEDANAALEIFKLLGDSRNQDFVGELLQQFVPKKAAMISMDDPAAAQAQMMQMMMQQQQTQQVAAYAGPTKEEISAKIMDMCLNMMGLEDMVGDTPLAEAGLDSLSMVDFRNRLAREFTGISMPAALLFDYPSVNQLADHFEETMRASAGAMGGSTVNSWGGQGGM